MQHISPCYAYRYKGADETAEAYGLRMADELEAKIIELGADSVAAFIAETVVGATLGAVTATPGYFRRIREICDRYGVLLILDEVMCGMGRTGTRYACEQEGIAPDMLTVAKGLGAGYQPIGALLIAEKIHRAIERGSNVVMHGHTFTGHPTACAAALATQQEIRDRDLLSNVKRQGDALRAARLSGVALPAEILLTPALVANTPAPPGVGWFRAPSFQESLAGFLSHRAADYRD